MNKRKLIIAAAGFAVLCGFFYLRFRGSIVIRPTREYQDCEVVYYYQKEESWKEDYLGDSPYRMGTSGCLTSCIASVLCMEGITETDPGTLNELFSDGSVYDKEGNIRWDEMEQALDVTVERRDALSAAELETLLDNHIYPIVRVRVWGLGNFHYVVITGSHDGNFECMDPLRSDKEPVSLSKFRNRIYAVRYVEKSAV